ncbi:MAG: carboxypeptidase-like regulatory domain-containing protein [Bacteroidales bacterium]|nr:carboxypeptidase-like regulatory domain-containing protein [Bacteroidales bacterium]
MKRLTAFIVTLLLCLAGYAQETEIVTVWGKAVDFISGEPVAHASVRVSGGNVGTVTNSEGVFSLKIPVAYADGILSVDCLGYSMWHADVSKMTGTTEKEPYSIGMMRTFFKLDSAVVRSIEPLELLKYAYSRVYYNYPTHREATTAFYREIIKKGSSKYLRLSEAVIDIDKASYTGYGTDKAAVYKGRTVSNYDQTDSILINYQGGVISALELDQVHNPFAGVPWQHVEMFYDFRMEEPRNIGDRMFYVVSFNQKATEKDMLCRGKVYIDTETYAIGRFEGWDNVEGRPYAYTDYIKDKPKDAKVAMKEVAWEMNYKESEGRWYLDYSSLSFQINVQRAGRLLRNTYSIVSEMAVTDHYPGNLEITGSARIRPRDQIADLVNDFTDDAFWGTYNIIEPDQSIEDAIRRIIRSLRRRR